MLTLSAKKSTLVAKRGGHLGSSVTAAVIFIPGLVTPVYLLSLFLAV